MKNKGILILIYSAIGGLAAVLLANYFQTLPWAGVLLGTLIGAFAYNPREIWNAIPQAYTQAEKKLPRIKSEVSSFFTFVAKLIMAISGVVYAAGVQIYFFRMFGLPEGDQQVVYVMIVLVTFYLSAISFVNFYLEQSKKLSQGKPIQLVCISWFFKLSEGSNWRMCIFCIFLPLLTLVAQLCVVGFCIKYLLYDCRHFIKKFIKTFVVLIYSKARLIIFLGGLMGGTIGFYIFSGSAFSGMLSGALCGGISYWIIAIKWLKLKPAF